MSNISIFDFRQHHVNETLPLVDTNLSIQKTSKSKNLWVRATPILKTNLFNFTNLLRLLGVTWITQ
jgi:hypothetical protein